MFFKKNITVLLFCLGIMFVLFYSFSTLTTKPRIWTDEAVSIDIARNYQTERILDVKVAPSEFSGFGERLQSTGYPVTVPLAWFFNFFGFGLAQARIYMLLWLLAVACFSFWLGKEWFGEWKGVSIFFLLISFASLYASGRTVVGEIPGFLFLLVGLYFLFDQKKYFWSGMVLGFAVVSKLSVFALVIPALVLTYLFDWRNFFRVLVPLALGMLPAGVTWIFLNLSNPFLGSSWENLFGFYGNPYGSSISSNIVHNLISSPHSTTLLYFGVLAVCVILARFVKGNEWKTLYNFVIVYGCLAFVYYLRSPGWLRYVLIAEFLVLFLLPHSLSLILENLREKFLVISKRRNLIFAVILGGLVLLQFIQLFFLSDIYISDKPLRVAEIINKDFAGKSVGVLNAIEVASLLETPNRYLALDLTGVPQVGKNPLMYDPLPEVLVSYPDHHFLTENQDMVNKKYSLKNSVGGYNIYELK